MKSAFGSKRKARKIEVDEDDGPAVEDSGSAQSKTPHSGGTLSNVVRKTFKKSSLRKSMVLADIDSGDYIPFEEDTISKQASEGAILGVGNEDLLRSTIGRSSSLNKKKTAGSRLSFGVGEIITGDAAEALEDDETFTSKKSALVRRLIESKTLRKSLPAYQIPMRSGEDDENRPIYSKDYLNELKSSTPSTPKDLRTLPATAEDMEGLDESELDGAMIVETEDRMELAPSVSAIPTEAEIRERKERRARLAQEQDFISLNDNDGDGSQQISLLPRKKKAETRLVREDEDLGEGFDEFVEDGRISIGKKAERAAKRKRRATMAELINEAEGTSSDDSDYSEAERRAAFESAQTRAGMDGLSKPDSTSTLNQIPPKITPLPNLSDCLQRLQTTLSNMQQELSRRNAKMEQLGQEKKEILAREEEVQRLLQEAGERYSAMRADTGLPPVDAKTMMEARNGFTDPIDVSRGLESFGNTPIIRPQIDDVG